MKRFICGFIAIVLVLCLVSMTNAQTTTRTIDFTFPEDIQAGSPSSFSFVSNEVFTKDQYFATQWDNIDAEASRPTNCLLIQRNTSYPPQLQAGLNFGHLYCYLSDAKDHYTTSSTGLNDNSPQNYWVARIENDGNWSPDNCNNNVRPVFKIRFYNDVPENTPITCDYVATNLQILPQRSNLIQYAGNQPNPEGGALQWKSTRPVSLTIFPTKAWIMSMRPHPTDQWTFLTTMNSTRTGLVELTTISNTFSKTQSQARTQFGFFSHGYSAGSKGSFWCLGTEGEFKGQKVARVVPTSTSTLITAVSHLSIYFEKANAPAECILRLQPLRMGVQLTDPRIYLRLHQQPLFQLFNVTQDHFKFEIQHTIYRPGNTGRSIWDNNNVNNHPDALAINAFQPEALIRFPIEPGYTKGTSFFIKFTPLEGTIVTGEELVDMIDATTDPNIDTNYAPTLAPDTSDPSRLKFIYNGDNSQSIQLLGLTIRLPTPLTTPSRLRFQVDIIDQQGVLLNSLPEEQLELDFASPLQIQAGGYDLEPKKITISTIFKPTYNSVGTGSMVRLVSHTANWFNSTESCTAQRVLGEQSIKSSVIKVKGDIFTIIDAEIEQNEEINVICTILTQFPFNYDEEDKGKSDRYIRIETGAIPPKFTLPLTIYGGDRAANNPDIDNFYNYYGNDALHWPGFVALRSRNIKWEVPTRSVTPAMILNPLALIAGPSSQEVIEYEPQGIFDPLQGDEPAPPTKEDPQGWNFPGYGYSFTSTIPWTSTSTLETVLKPSVERVLDVIRKVANDKGQLIFSTYSWNDIFFQGWGEYQNRFTIGVDLLGQLQDTQSPFEYTRSYYPVSWSISPVEGEDWNKIRESIRTALKTAVEDGVLISPRDVLATNDNTIISDGPLSTHCKGSNAFGRPGCITKFSGVKCENHTECLTNNCNDDKVCASSSQTLQDDPLTRPEALGRFSPERFNYVTSSAVNNTVFGLLFIIICTMLF